MTALIDTSVVIALSNAAEPHHAWSTGQLTDLKIVGPVLVCDVVYAELSAGFNTRDEVDAVLAEFGLDRCPSVDDGLFKAGQRYKAYKRTAGTKSNVLPDFIVGGIASSLGIPVVTANKKDFQNFFTGLTVIHPAGVETVP